jgi:hypothetical protein
MPSQFQPPLHRRPELQHVARIVESVEHAVEDGPLHVNPDTRFDLARVR